MTTTVSHEGRPPVLEGFTFLRPLGSGGFADVYLYQQHLPERLVAVKVLRVTVDDEEARRAFITEANAATKVSHPHIVSVFMVGVSPDRRLYLVMEFYPQKLFEDDGAQQPLALHKALSVGILISSAVETAHRAGIIHRDIKPSNIFVSAFNEPALGDFGISGMRGDGSDVESLGFSPGYSPPEVIANTNPGDERSDVYSLAATMWALLTTFSPHEVPGAQNTKAELMARGLSGAVGALGRDDVPRTLEMHLRQALSLDPAARPQTAQSFASGLLNIEYALGYTATPFKLLTEHSDGSAPQPVRDKARQPGAPTQVGRSKVIHPDGPPVPPPPPARSKAEPPLVGAPARPIEAFGAGGPANVRRTATRRRAGVLNESSDGLAAMLPKGQGSAAGRSRRSWMVAGGVAAAVALLVGIGATVLNGGSDAAPDESLPEESPELIVPNQEVAVAAVEDAAWERTGTDIEFSWTHPSESGVSFEVTPLQVDAVVSTAVVTTTRYVLPEVPTSEAPCVRVIAVVDGVRSDAVRICAEADE